MKPIKDRIDNLIFLCPSVKENRDNYMEQARRAANLEDFEGVSLIASNCIAGEIYSILGLPFLSPTINSSMNRADFVDLCADLSGYMQCEMKYVKKHRGSVVTELVDHTGELRSIPFLWPHETDPKKIISDFDRRRGRINYSKMILLTDCNDFGLEKAKEYEKIECLAKALFVPESSNLSNLDCSIVIPGYRDGQKISRFQYMQRNGLYEFQEKWDFVTWLNSKLASNDIRGDGND